MKKNLLISFLFSILTSFFVMAAEAAPIEKMVAVVNDEVITSSELQHAIHMYGIQQHAKNSNKDTLRNQALTQLINKKLQLQFAKMAGINVTPTDVDNAIKHVAQLNHMTVASLYKNLAHDGISPASYKHEITEQITLQKIQQQEVVKHMTISNKEVDAFIHSNPVKHSAHSHEYHVVDVLIPLQDKPSAEESSTARKIADSIIFELQQGKKLKDILAAQNQAVQVTDLGWRKLHEMPNVFAEAIAPMQTKGVAGPVQAPNGMHILRVVALHAIDGAQPNLDRKQIEEILLQKKFDDALLKWITKLRSQAYIQTNL